MLSSKPASLLRKRIGPAALPIVFLCTGILLSATTTKGEYRAFLLEITSADGTSSRSVTSSLDPLQYKYYYPLRPGEKVNYTQTWRCTGRTGGIQPVCPNPKNQQQDQQADAGLDKTPSSKSPERTPASK
jgi:hypothetical protein